MANYNKSFNFRNGVQVDDDNFIVNANGLVGIGTSIPTEFLDVHGTAKVTGLITATNLTITGVSNFFNDVKVGSGIALNKSTGIISATRFDGDASGLTNIYAIAVDGWYINAGNISTSFNVGIGSDIPSSKLDVVGNVKVSGIVTASSFSGHQVLVGSESSATKIFIVKVAPKTSNHRYFGTGSTNAYFIDGIQSPFLTLLPGKTYYFNQEDISNTGHPLRLYLKADKTSSYSTNVITSAEVPGISGSYTQITVTDITPIVLHYQCSTHAYMGNSIQFNSNVVNTPYQITALDGIIAATGVVTAYSFSGFGTNIQGINATNINNGTLSNSRLAQNVSISGIISAPSGIITSLTTTNLFNTGIATITTLSVGNASVTGIITAPAFVGSLVGIASTARDLTSNARVNITHIGSQTSSIGISTVSTRLYAESIGVGTNSPSSDIHIRRNGQSILQVTSNTAEAIVAVGRSTTLTGNNGALIFGNTSGIYPYSNSRTLDIVNYGTGNLNYYINYEVGGFGNFNWIDGQNANNPLMSLTYQGNLGIGVTNPSVKLQVSGTASVSSLITQNITATNNITATGIGNSTSVSILYVYGGKSQILKSNGTEMFPTLLENGNLNINSGTSTFNNIDLQNNITVPGKITSTMGVFGINAVIGGTVVEETTSIDRFGSIGVGINTLNMPAYSEFASRNRRITCLGIGNDSFGAAFGHVSIGTTNILPAVKLNVIGGDISVGINTSNGLVLTSANGTKYRLFVSNAGVLSTILVP